MTAPRLPNFLIIGAQRCGTTWLADILSTHPDIFMPAKKELHFFDRDYPKGLSFYTSYFEGSDGHRRVGEASASYLCSSEVAERIAHDLPEVKLIAILREPVDRLVSRYLNMRSAYRGTRKLTLMEKIDQKPSMIQEGHYYTHLSRYFSLLPREQILVASYHDIGSDPIEFLRAIYTFLGIQTEHFPAISHSKVNSARSKPYVGRSSILYYFGVVARRVGLYRIADAVLTANSSRREVITPEERRLIYDTYYRREVELLKSEYGIDLTRP